MSSALYAVIWTIITHLATLFAQTTKQPYPTYPNDGWKHPIDESTRNVLEGENVTLPCRNATPGRFYGIYWTNLNQWRRSRYTYGYRTDSSPVVDPYLLGRVSLDKANLSIVNAKEGDAGVYDCTIVFFYYKTGIPRATTWATHQLNVFVPPKAAVYPEYITPSKGDDVVFDCKILKGTEEVNVTWTRGGGTPLAAGRYDFQNNGTRLVIMNITSKEEGVYKCSVKNDYGDHSVLAKVKMKVPPKIITYVSTVHVNVDGDGKLTCHAMSFPVSTFHWKVMFENGTEATPQHIESYKTKVSVTDTRNISLYVSESDLLLKGVKAEIWKYRFSCIATNSEGYAVHNFTIEGYNYPSRPSIRQIKLSSSAATIYWAVTNNGGAPLTSVIIWYRNISQIGWTKVLVAPVKSAEHTIKHLSPGTSYEFKLVAENEVGRSGESGVYVARTRLEENQPIERPNAAPSHLNATAVIGIFAGTFVAIGVGIFIVFMLVRKLQKPAPGSNREMLVQNGRHISIDNGSTQGVEHRISEVTNVELEPLMPKIDRWEFPRDRLRLSCVLGSGAFGLVRRAQAEGIQGTNGRVKVAVKMLKDSDSPTAKKDLLAELEVLKFIPSHPNVVCLLGCCTRSDPILVIVEYCANGDLQGFLRNSRGISERYYRNSYGGSVPNLTSKMLLTFGQQIARGMAHLASLKVIHRDLAARNILVDEHLTCKVGDFGFARDVYVEDHYMRKSHNGRFPVKWMAIESLVDTISTSKSDVWSFGVVLWEIITLGASPYPGMNAYEVVTFLQDGYRMDKPKHCSDELYGVLIDCWHVWPQRRPSFEQLADTLRRMCDNDKDEINMNYYQDHLYVNFDLPTTGTSSSFMGNPTDAGAVVEHASA